MKQNFTRFAAMLTLLLSAQTGFSQVSETFNTRPEAMSGTEIKDYLLSKGWQFSNSSIQTYSGTVVEGDGLLQTNSLGNTSAPFGVTTPLLKAEGSSLQVQFKYRFTGTGPQQRTLHILLTDCQGNLVSTLQSSIVANSTNLVDYSNTFSIIPGKYRIQIGFTGTGGTSGCQIDAVTFQDVSLCYPNGVNSSPQGTTDNFNGTNLKTASGNVLLNDTDADNDELEVQLLSGPASNVGTLSLGSNGDFTFTPAPGYNGPGFVFEYMVCENSCEQLCGSPVTAIVNFPIGAPTPVMMLDFSGVLSGNTVQLNWSTATELNNARFDIMRSEDGSNFTKVGEVAGKGTVTSITDYTWKDFLNNVSSSLLHYKLRQVDIDGSVEYSKTVVVRLNADKKVMASVAPNPVQAQTRLTVQLERKATVQVRLLNNMGKELTRKSYVGLEGSNSYTIEETTQLLKGLYLLEIVVDGKERTLLKIIK